MTPYQKRREKELAEKAERYWADPEAGRKRSRDQYAKHQEKRVAYAREYRRQRKERLAAEAKAKYHANRDEINARRKELRKRPEASKKAYAAMRQWIKDNPDRALVQHAKRLLADQLDCRCRDIPDDIAEAKAEQIKILRWLREQQAPTPDRSGEADKTAKQGLAGGESGLPEGSSS